MSVVRQIATSRGGLLPKRYACPSVQNGLGIRARSASVHSFLVGRSAIVYSSAHLGHKATFAAPFPYQYRVGVLHLQQFSCTSPGSLPSCSISIDISTPMPNIAVNATVRGNSSRAFTCLLFAAHVALPPALGTQCSHSRCGAGGHTDPLQASVAMQSCSSRQTRRVAVASGSSWLPAPNSRSSHNLHVAQARLAGFLKHDCSCRLQLPGVA